MTQRPDLLPRHDWTRADIAALYDLPLDSLMARALEVKRANWPDGKIQKSQLLSIKTGGCAEDCGYCSQSAHFDTGLDAGKLMPLDEVVTAARRAKENGADRFCMGAAWRSLKDRDLPKVAAMISAVKAEGLETCVTLGMLEDGQAEALKLEAYEHMDWQMIWQWPAVGALAVLLLFLALFRERRGTQTETPEN